MATYDYIAGKKRIDEILDHKLNVIEIDKIPNEDSFTYSNAYYGWVTGIFVDIRNSTELFSKKDKEIVSKIIRSFTSEIIEILRIDDNLREIGIRGDCVYAIYTTPKQYDTYEAVDKVILINTFLNMLDKLLSKKGFPTIKAGIGISTEQELVIKAGRKGVGINNSVWIGDAVTKASKLSSLGNTGFYRSIIMSDVTYQNVIEQLKKDNQEENVEHWFGKYTDAKLGTFYDAGMIKIQFDKWISEGMKDN